MAERKMQSVLPRSILCGMRLIGVGEAIATPDPTRRSRRPPVDGDAPESRATCDALNPVLSPVNPRWMPHTARSGREGSGDLRRTSAAGEARRIGSTQTNACLRGRKFSALYVTPVTRCGEYPKRFCAAAMRFCRDGAPSVTRAPCCTHFTSRICRFAADRSPELALTRPQMITVVGTFAGRS